MDSRDTKEELSNIKSIADEVCNRAERGIYRLQQERDSVSRGEETLMGLFKNKEPTV